MTECAGEKEMGKVVRKIGCPSVLRSAAQLSTPFSAWLKRVGKPFFSLPPQASIMSAALSRGRFYSLLRRSVVLKHKNTSFGRLAVKHQEQEIHTKENRIRARNWKFQVHAYVK